MSMEPKIVAWLVAEIDAEGSITSSRGYNCQVAGGGAGIYDVTIGEGGGDESVIMTTVTPFTAAVGGAASARGPVVHHTSDTVKRVEFFDDADAAADPSGFLVEFKRYPSSILASI